VSFLWEIGTQAFLTHTGIAYIYLNDIKMVTLYANGLMDSERIREDCAIQSKDTFKLFIRTTRKLLLKVHNDPAIEIKVEDEGTTVSVDIVEPKALASWSNSFGI